MYLKTLTLRGFKSFAEKTTFSFEPGVTAVVGPNGSGKSNVVDALAWVMGEQGVKTLRGGKMEDVIFAGTAQKGPLGRAEVTLTIDNSDGALPIEYTEVTIQRRIFRNGGSEYSINGSSCRLLDVQELLSDSGLGRQMHVIVGQGQLDTVLRATPEERRGFIEEAAGILKHRKRKERTERKLEAMQANLTRVNDLAGELRRQLKPLGRQAEMAKHAQSIQSGVREAKARLMADDLVRLDRVLAELSEQDNQSRSARAVEQSRIEELEAQVVSLEEAAVSDEFDKARAVTYGLRGVQDKFRSLEQLATQRVALLSQAPQVQSFNPDETDAAASATAAELGAVVAEQARLDGTLETADAALVEAANQLAEIDESIRKQNALISEHELKRSSLTSAVTGYERNVATLDTELERGQAALESAQARVTEANAQLAEMASDSEPSNADDSQLSASHALAVRAEAEAEEKLAKHDAQINEASRVRAAHAARAQALDEALKRGDDNLDISPLRGISGRIPELVKVQSGFETPIAAALGSLANAYGADSLTSAIGAAAKLRDNSVGRHTFVVTDGAEPERPGTVPTGSTWAPDVVDGPAGVKIALARTCIVDNLDRALQAMTSNNELTLVTLAGDVVQRYGATGGNQDQSRLELQAACDDAHADETQASTRLEQLTQERRQLVAELESAREEVAAIATRLKDADAQRVSIEQQLARIKVQVEAQTQEAQRIAQRLEHTQQQHAAATSQLSSAKAELVAFEQADAPTLFADNSREEAKAKLDKARDAQTNVRIEVETLNQRHRSLQERIDTLKIQAKREREANVRAARQAAVQTVQREQSQAVLSSLPPILQLIDESVATAQLDQEREDAKRKEQHSQLQVVRERLKEMQHGFDSVTEVLHATGMRIHERKLERDAVIERAHNELGLEPDILVSEYGPDVPMPSATEADGQVSEVTFDRDRVKANLAKLQTQLSRLGTINPLALEEFAALEQRHKFLTDQLEDLHQTRKNLLDLIADLDDTMQGIFESAFADTQAAFNDVFPIMFPGGVGKIELTDPSQPLTTGIDIQIKPAGKKINRLSLLSGGERSLGAIALLVAIFKARPSPFYVMDEVEAALDDANLGRLLAIFEDLRTHSQLIIITHQKRTMEIADALYGVSMRKNGITSVVGQRLAHKEDA